MGNTTIMNAQNVPSERFVQI